MAIISLRLSKEDDKLLKEYVKMNNLNMSSYIRDTILDAIEDDFLDTDKILKAKKQSKKGKTFDAEDVWKALGV